MSYQRIACLSTEAVETLYALGAEDCIAGISGFTVYPPRAPKVYFEEWHDPMISGIGWVSELIGIAGGSDVFTDRARAQGAKQRVVSAEEVIERAPEIIIGSWCGKKFVPDHVRARPGWESVPAVRDNELHEIKSADILAPGAIAITHGLTQLTQLFKDWAARQPA